LAALVQIKSNIDSGIFLPIQDAAVTALTGDQAWLADRNAEYQLRRDILLEVLVDAWGLSVAKPQAGLYLWPQVPSGCTAASFADRILQETGVSVTPGSAFGPHGEGYLRISLGQATERVRLAAQRLRDFKL
jgi:LL-diaminopimelate aminotransferase